MPLQIYTARISYGGPDRLDVTRKGGSIFGPSWDLLNAAKSGAISWERYVPLYHVEMRASWRQHEDDWLELLRRDRVVLCCYCTDPERCHRTILAGLLVKAGEHVGLPAEYLGEAG